MAPATSGRTAAAFPCAGARSRKLDALGRGSRCVRRAGLDGTWRPSATPRPCVTRASPPSTRTGIARRVRSPVSSNATRTQRRRGSARRTGSATPASSPASSAASSGKARARTTAPFASRTSSGAPARCRATRSSSAARKTRAGSRTSILAPSAASTKARRIAAPHALPARAAVWARRIASCATRSAPG